MIPQTYALDRRVTGIGHNMNITAIFLLSWLTAGFIPSTHGLKFQDALHILYNQTPCKYSPITSAGHHIFDR